jgi:hypothetical protein
MILFTKTEIEKSNLAKQWLERNQNATTVTKTRPVSDDLIALSSGEITEFDDVMDALEREKMRGGWVETYVLSGSDRMNFNHPAAIEQEKIGRYLHGWDNEKWLVEHGYKISETDRAERAANIERREKFENANDIYDAD